MPKCPQCKGFVILDSYVPVYKGNVPVDLKRYLECENGHKMQVKGRKERKPGG